MTVSREIAEGPMRQGEDESIVYTLTTTNWGSSPTAPSVTVFSKDTSDGSWDDVTTTVMTPNSPSVSSDIITLSALCSLTAGTLYGVETQFTIGGSTFEAYAFIYAER